MVRGDESSLVELKIRRCIYQSAWESGLPFSNKDSASNMRA